MPTSPIDHDGLFKELIRVFTFEFLELFVPELSIDIDRTSFEFLDKELLQVLDQGDRKEVDLLVKTRFKGEPVFFLIHFEVQSSHQNWSPRRMFQYASRLYERFSLPIYPIALLTWDSPQKAASSAFSFGFPHLKVLEFNFHTIQLNRLPWRAFMRIENPVATALMAKMDIPKSDRPKVKLEYLRMITTLKIDVTKSALIWQFMETYLRLNAQEEQMAQQLIQTELPPEKQEKVMVITNSYIEKGLLLGEAKGERQAKLSNINRLVERKFGESVLALHKEKIEELPITEIDALFDVAIFFDDASELAAWFKQ